jgi:hypothetical protein
VRLAVHQEMGRLVLADGIKIVDSMRSVRSVGTRLQSARTRRCRPLANLTHQRQQHDNQS